MALKKLGTNSLLVILIVESIFARTFRSPEKHKPEYNQNKLEAAKQVPVDPLHTGMEGTYRANTCPITSAQIGMRRKATKILVAVLQVNHKQ